MGQQASTQIEEVEEVSWLQLKSDIIDFVRRKGIILEVSRAGWTEEQRKTDREERRDVLVKRFEKFTNTGEKKSLVEELKKMSSKDPENIIKKLEETIHPLKF